MRSRAGSVIADGDGVWRVRVSRGRDPVTGSRLYVERVVRGSRDDAEAMRARLLVDHGDGALASRSLTVADFLRGVYLPDCERRLRADTVAHYRGDAEAHVIPVIGSTRLADVDASDVERVLASVGSPGARKAAFKLLRQALRQARRWKLVRDVATDAIHEPRVPHYEPRVLDAAQASAVLEAFRGSPVEVAVLLALGCGLRRSEICGLDWADVDLEAGEVHVRHSYVVTDGVGHLSEPKTFRSRRVVSVPAGFLARLRDIAPDAPRGPVMVGEGGGRMNPDVLTALYDSRARAEGVRWTSLKDLRHSHATIMLDAGVDVVVVSRRLGHSSVSVTDRFYLRPRQAADARAAAAFDALGLAPHRPATREDKEGLREP